MKITEIIVKPIITAEGLEFWKATAHYTNGGAEFEYGTTFLFVANNTIQHIESTFIEDRKSIQ